MPKLTTPHQWAKDRTPAEWANHHIKVVVALIVLLVMFSYPVGVFVMAMIGAQHAEKKVEAQAPANQRPSGSGVVVSMSDGVMTIQHSGVPGTGIAAGTTPFPTDPRIIARTRVGDPVTFYLDKTDANGWAIHSLRNGELEDMGINPVLGPPAKK